MALGPISAPLTPVQPAPTRDVGAAQRAFFQAALGQAPAPAVVAPSPPAQAAPMAKADPSEDPRNYRPGKLLDIKV
jgi:hypothetical protein